jgi:hypothetical protein
VKLVREYINEKFFEDSDPIDDLGIGLAKEYKELEKIYISDYTLSYFQGGETKTLCFVDIIIRKYNIDEYDDNYVLSILQYIINKHKFQDFNQNNSDFVFKIVDILDDEDKCYHLLKFVLDNYTVDLNKGNNHILKDCLNKDFFKCAQLLREHGAKLN